MFLHFLNAVSHCIGKSLKEIKKKIISTDKIYNISNFSLTRKQNVYNTVDNSF